MAPPKKRTASRKPARRTTTPKRSPLRGMPVDEWIAARSDGWRREAARAVIGLVAGAVPRAELSIKWGQPVFELSGPFAYVKIAREHVTLGFWRGAELVALHEDLEGEGIMRHVKLTSMEAVRAVEIEGLARAAAALNLKLGDPTRRKTGR